MPTTRGSRRKKGAADAADAADATDAATKPSISTTGATASATPTRTSGRKRTPTVKGKANAESNPPPKKKKKALSAKSLDANPTQDEKTKSPGVIPSEDSKPDNNSAGKTVGSADFKQDTLAGAKDNNVNTDMEVKASSRADTENVTTRKRGNKYRRIGTKISWTDNETRTYDIQKPPNSTTCSDDLNNLRSTEAEAVQVGYENDTTKAVEENNTDKPVTSVNAQKEEVGPPDKDDDKKDTPKVVEENNTDKPVTSNNALIDAQKEEASSPYEEDDSPTTMRVQLMGSKKTKALDFDSDSDSSVERDTKQPSVARKMEAKTEPSSDSEDLSVVPTKPSAAAKNEYDSNIKSSHIPRKPSPTKKKPSAEGTAKWKSPVIDADASTDSSEPPFVTFPFDGLKVADLKRVENSLTPNSLKVALVTTKTNSHFTSLQKAPFWSKDKRRLRWSDALADNLYCFVRNWMGRYGFTEKVLWLEPYFWWRLSNPVFREGLIKQWATVALNSLVANFLIAIPIIENGHVSTAFLIEPSVCLLGPRTDEGETTRILHLDSWQDDSFHSSRSVVTTVQDFLLDVGDEARRDISCRYSIASTRDDVELFMDTQDPRADFVTTQGEGTLDCLLHALHNTYTACKLVDKTHDGRQLVTATKFEESLELCRGFNFSGQQVDAFRRDIATLARELKRIKNQEPPKLLPSRPPLHQADGNAKRLNIPQQPPADGSKKEGGTPNPSRKLAYAFRAQNDQSRSAQKARKEEVKDALQVRKNNSNRSKPVKGDRPRKAQNQLDSRMRRQFATTTKHFEEVLKMTTPVTKSDDFVAVEDMNLRERRWAAEENQWPDTIPGMFLYTEQKPNDDGSSSALARDLFLDKPMLMLLAPSQQQGLKLLEQIRKNEIDVKLVTSGAELMEVTQKPEVVRSKEPRRPRELNEIYPSISATNLLKTGPKNEETP